MSANKYTVLIVGTVTAACIFAAIAAAAVGAPIIVPITTELLAFTGVAVLCVLCLRMFSSADDMQKALQTDPPGKITIRKSSPVRSLDVAFNDFISKQTDNISRFEKDRGDIAVQLQLLQRQKHNTEAIIYSIRDAVIVVDAFDRILLANEAAEKLFRFRSVRDTTPVIGDVIKDEEFVRLIIRCRRSKTPHVRHEMTFSGDDADRVFDCIVSCVKDDKGLVCGVVVVMHDVTREKEISQMKNDFVSHVSHELKTPLASINAYAEMLVDGEAQDEHTRNEFCGIIQAQAQRLNRLIEDILNISRIESGLTKVDKHPLSLAILVKEATEAISSYAREKNISVRTQAPIIFDQALADRDMITQVIVNLLSNAVKYTPSGGQVDVSVQVDQIENTVQVTVTDTGVGIPAEDIEHVFEKFFRVEANKKQAKGTGLGLNLVKQIVEKVHDGSVFVTSVQGQGSTFGFALPLATQRVAQTA